MPTEFITATTGVKLEYGKCRLCGDTYCPGPPHFDQTEVGPDSAFWICGCGETNEMKPIKG